MSFSAGQILTAAELNAAAPEEGTSWPSPIVNGITEGNGTTVARYQRNGGLVSCYFKFTLGSTSAITGDVVLDLPVDALFQRAVGTAYFNDEGTDVFVGQCIISATTTQASVRVINAASTYGNLDLLSATVPFTWVTGDIIVVHLSYFAS